MNECNCCKMPVGISCCFNCGRDSGKCGVWHNCGENCPGWKKRIKNDLISRSALIERYGEPCHSFLDVIETMPAVDAVEVVRCKDCMYYKSNSNYSGLCRRLKWPTGEDVAIIQTDKNDFCSFGETEVQDANGI